MNDTIEEPVDAEEGTKEARANPYNIDAEVIFNPEAPVAHARDGKSTHRITAYNNIMEIDMENIYKDDNMTCRKIYKAIDELYFEEVTLFPQQFLEHCKDNPNVPQNNTSEIEK